MRTPMRLILRERLAPLGADDQRRILGANAVECYGLALPPPDAG